jgi:cobalt-zinc-cadmium efflux system membrane fusion protein
MEETAGIQTVAARQSSATTSISCNVRLAFNEDKMADVRAFVPGVVRTVRVRVGELVQKGDPLFELDSVHVSDLHAERIAARERVRVATTQVQRMRELQKTDVVSARSLETAEEALTQATSMLAGIEAALKTLGATSRGSVVLRAPIMGEVVERQAIQGVLANQDDSLAKIVDVSSLWAFCDVSESHVHGLAVGQSLNIELEGIQPIVGELDWISPQIDPISRTILTRAVVPNEGRELRANQFGRAQILGAAGAGVEVPRSAIQRVESQDVIFVRDEPGVFSPRIVTQHSEGEWVRVTGRIKAGEPVVTQGAVFLRTEIMPGSIGAGCCEITPGGK